MLQSMGSQRAGHDLIALQGGFSTIEPPGEPPCVLFLCCVKVVYKDCLHLHVYVTSYLQTSFFSHAHGYYIRLPQCFDNAVNLQQLPFFLQEKNLNCLAWHSRTFTVCTTYISILVSPSSPNETPSSTGVMQPPLSWLLFTFPFLLHYLKSLPSMTCTHLNIICCVSNELINKK